MLNQEKKPRRKTVYLKETCTEWNSTSGPIWAMEECGKNDPKAVKFIKCENKP